MPTYVYRIQATASGGCEVCRETFEKTQRMSAAALEKCPQCGAGIERVIQTPMLGNIDGRLKGPSDAALKGAGFTKFKRNGKGHYDKLYGNAPSGLGGG